MRINDSDIARLKAYKNLTCVNIGLHTFRQLSAINKHIENALPVRFMVQDKNYDLLLESYPERLNSNNTKQWKLNECNMPNEEWVFLEGDAK